jgi:HAMP domain-containing protein
MFGAIRKSITLKVSLILALVTLLTTTGAAIFITSRQVQTLEMLTVNKARLASALGAQMYGVLMEDGIDNGLLTPGDVFDTSYQEIRGYDWGGKPKYHTRYDGFTDRVVLAFQDRFLDTPEFMFAVGADVNGYVPTHNTPYQQALTGDVARDLAGNRTKRIFNSPVELKAATNEAGTLVQQYKRDTGADVWDVSTPVFVKGKHWGGFRIGVSVDEIMRHKTELMVALSATFAILLILSVAVIFVMVKRSMKPLEQLATTAMAMSTGEELDNPVKAATIDEVGRMAKSLDRLRTSLKAAMERLGE